jgi:DNA-binding transcriptional LysR family regulator
LRARVKGLLDGLEAEVDLAVDVMLPADRLGQVLRAFAQEFPTVQLRLHVEALGAITALVCDGIASIGVSGPLAWENDGLDSIAAGSTQMVPVAAPGHPLGQMAAIPPGAARDHIQLVLSDRSRLTEGRDFAVISRKTWRLADLSAKHALLREGVGWGNMPLPMVEADLASGALVKLNLPDHSGGLYRLSAIWRRDSPPGPAAAWLRDQFVELGRSDSPALAEL